jgi:hypothetical protein
VPILRQSESGYLAGSPNDGRYWNSRFEALGDSHIDRDNGYSATLVSTRERTSTARSVQPDHDLLVVIPLLGRDE